MSEEEPLCAGCGDVESLQEIINLKTQITVLELKYNRLIGWLGSFAFTNDLQSDGVGFYELKDCKTK